MEHIPITAFPGDGDAVMALAFLAADYGVAADIIPVIISKAVVAVSGFPLAAVYAVFRSDRSWEVVDAGLAQTLLSWGGIVAAIGGM